MTPRMDALHSAEERGIFAILNSTPTSDEANALVDELTNLVGEQDASGRTYKRRNRSEEKLRHAVASFLADLLRAAAHAKSGGFVYRSLKSDEFTGEAVSHRTFVALMDAMKALGLIEHVAGAPRFIRLPFAEELAFGTARGRAARFRGTLGFLDLVGSRGVRPEDVSSHFRLEMPRQVLVLKSASTGKGRKKRRGASISFQETEITARLRAEVTALNSFLQRFKISGASFSGLRRVFNEGDAPDYAWNKGGRLIDDAYQTLSSEVRRGIRINDEPVVEIDVSASHLTLLHGILGYPFEPSSDPYEVEGVSSRDVCKTWLTISLGSGKPVRRWTESANKNFIRRHGKSLSDTVSASEISAAMLSRYPVLGELESKGVTWADLQFHEAEAVIGAMNDLMGQGIASLPVHDSLIVTQRHEQSARTALERSYETVCGVKPLLKVKQPISSDLLEQALHL